MQEAAMRQESASVEQKDSESNKHGLTDWGWGKAIRNTVAAIIKDMVKPECLIDDQGSKHKCA